MTKKVIILICIFLVLLISAIFLVNIFSLKNIYKIQDKEIISLLKTNIDGLNYINKYPDFKINKKEILTKESIKSGQDALDFKEVYQNLDLENNRYIKVDLINLNNINGLIAVLDFKENKVVKVFGILMLESN